MPKKQLRRLARRWQAIRPILENLELMTGLEPSSVGAIQGQIFQMKEQLDMALDLIADWQREVASE
jgi:hypothetical protein